jgi:multidrug resistance protein, MATE family
MVMLQWFKLKRRVAAGLRRFAGGRLPRPDAARRRRWASFFASLSEVSSLAWPIAAAMFFDSAMGLVDTKIVASLGKDALGGVGIATTLMFVNYAMVFGFMRGVKVRTAHAVGAGTPLFGVAFATAGSLFGLGMGLFVVALGRDASPVLSALSVDPAMIPFARDFLAARTLGAPAICVVSALVQHRQGLGDSRTPMVIGIAGNVVNGFAAYGLALGRFGLPALGVAGAGYGTALAEWLQAFVLVALLLRDRAAASRSGIVLPSLRTAAGAVAALGAPTGAQFGVEMMAFTTLTTILGGIGAKEIAAHQVAMSVLRTSFLPGIAVGEATSVMVGKALGARDLPAADRATRAGVTLAVAFMTLCGILLGVFSRSIGAAFTSELEVVTIVSRLLILAALFQAMDAVTIVLRGALRAAKDVRVVALTGILVAWGCIPMAAHVFGRVLGMGALGGWLGFLGETSIAAALFWRRWTTGAWRADYGEQKIVVGRASDPELTPAPVSTA